MYFSLHPIEGQNLNISLHWIRRSQGFTSIFVEHTNQYEKADHNKSAQQPTLARYLSVCKGIFIDGGEIIIDCRKPGKRLRTRVRLVMNEGVCTWYVVMKDPQISYSMVHFLRTFKRLPPGEGRIRYRESLFSTRVSCWDSSDGRRNQVCEVKICNEYHILLAFIETTGNHQQLALIFNAFGHWSHFTFSSKPGWRACAIFFIKSVLHIP